MIAKHKINMDIYRLGVTPQVNVVQDDKYSRDLEISLYNDGTAWEPGEETSAVIRYIKEDKKSGSYDLLPDGTQAWKIEGNVLTVALAPQVCTTPGRVDLDVCLTSGEAVLNTFAVGVHVQPIQGLSVTSEDYYKLSGTVPISGWTPDMYLGTDAEGNVVVREAPVYETVEVDATLTQAGQAADAKAVGDKLAETVRTINGVGPDEDGNISMTISTLPRPAVAEVGQYLRVAAVDENGQITALETVDLETQTGENDGWRNLQDLSGTRYTGEVYGADAISDNTPVAFKAGAYPLTWETTQTQTAESTYTRDETRWFFDIANALAGDNVEIEVLFPTAVYTGLDYSYQGFKLNCYNTLLIGSKFFTMEYNRDGTETFEVTSESLFESHTLEPISDASGVTIGFRLSGKLAGDLKHFGCDVTTSDFTNEKPVTYTCQVTHASHDDIRYRVNYTEEEDTEEDTAGGLPVFVQTTPMTSEKTTLSAEESAELTALAEAKTPFIMNYETTEGTSNIAFFAVMSGLIMVDGDDTTCGYCGQVCLGTTTLPMRYTKYPNTELWVLSTS